MLYRGESFFAFLRELLHLLLREDVAESCHGWLEFFLPFLFWKAVARPEGVKEEGRCPDWMAERPGRTDPPGRRRSGDAPLRHGRLVSLSFPPSFSGSQLRKVVFDLWTWCEFEQGSRRGVYRPKGVNLASVEGR